MRYDTPFVWKRGQVSLDRQMVASYRDHGISEGLFREWVYTMFPAGSVKHRMLVARAYDNAHHTTTHLSLPAISDLPDFTALD